MKIHRAVLPALILILGFALRFYGVSFGLPHLYHADEPIVVNHALAFGSGDLNPHFFKIPPLVSYLLFLIYGVVFCAGKIMGLFADSSAYEKFFYANPGFFYLTARVVFGVLMGTAGLYAFWRVLKRHFSPETAMTSFFIFSVCFLHVRDSHYVYADIPLMLVMIIAFGAFFDLQEAPSFRKHLEAGALIGLAAAVKYNGTALIIPYLAASFLSSRKMDIKGWIAAAMTAGLVFILLNPFSVLDPRFFISELRSQAAAQGGTPAWHHLTYSLAGGAGWPVLAACLGGIIISIRSRRPKPLIFLSFLAAYYLILVKAGQPYDRYALPLLLPVIYFAGEFLVRLSAKVKFQKAFFFLGLAFLTAIPAAKSVLFDRIMARPDIRTQTLQWIENNIPPGNTIAMEWEFYMPRLSFSKHDLMEKKKEILKNPAVFSSSQSRRLDYLLETADKTKTYDLFFLVRDPKEPRFLFGKPVLPYDFSALPKDRNLYIIRLGIPETQSARAFFNAVQEQGTRIASFSPYRDLYRFLPYDLQPMTGGPFLWKELWNREFNGMALEIYKLKR